MALRSVIGWKNDKFIEPADRGTDLDKYNYKAGDIIAIMPAGWNWSKAERSHPDWFIAEADLLDSEVDALTAHGSKPDPNGFPVGPAPQRAWHLDLSLLPQIAAAREPLQIPRSVFIAAAKQKIQP